MIRCFVLAVSASLALAGCQVKEEKTGGPSPVRVKVMKVALSEQKTSGRFSGTVEEAAGTPLSFSVMGTVNAVSFRLGDRVEERHISTPLTYRDYTGTPEGSAYGLRKDYHEPLTALLSPRTPVPNLWLTGQSLMLHGVHGVTMTALRTCAAMGNGNLF